MDDAAASENAAAINRLADAHERIAAALEESAEIAKTALDKFGSGLR